MSRDLPTNSKEAVEQQAATSEVLEALSRARRPTLRRCSRPFSPMRTRLCEGHLARALALRRQTAGRCDPIQCFTSFRRQIHRRDARAQPGRTCSTGCIRTRAPSTLQTLPRSPVSLPHVLQYERARTVLGCPFAAGERIWSVLSSFIVRKSGPSPTSRSSWSKTSPLRPSSPSRMRGCSTSCATAPTIFRKRWSSRRRPRRC